MILNVATGSTALISAPKSRDSIGFVSSTADVRPILAKENTRPPTTKVETRVPTKA